MRDICGVSGAMLGSLVRSREARWGMEGLALEGEAEKGRVGSPRRIRTESERSGEKACAGSLEPDSDQKRKLRHPHRW